MDLKYMLNKRGDSFFKYTVKISTDHLVSEMYNNDKVLKLSYNFDENSYKLESLNLKYSFIVEENGVSIFDTNNSNQPYNYIINDNNEDIVLCSLDTIVPSLIIIIEKFSHKETFCKINPFKLEHTLGTIELIKNIYYPTIGECNIYYINLYSYGFNVIYNNNSKLIYAVDPFNNYEIINEYFYNSNFKDTLKSFFKIEIDNSYDVDYCIDNIQGKLTLPEKFSDKNKYKCVLLLSGSGYLDCDGNSGDLMWNTMKDIAYALSKVGYITYRYADRLENIGKGISGLYSDVKTVFDNLMELQFINNKEITVLGHSQGCILAAILANEYNNIGTLLLMAPQGKSCYEFLFEQYNSFYNVTEKGNSELEEFYQSLIGNQSYNNENQFYRKYKHEIKRYEDLAKLDIYKLYRNTKCKLYLMHGKTDYQVKSEHSIILFDHLSKYIDIEVKLYEGLDHLFMKTRLDNIGDYGNYHRNIDKKVIYDICDILSKGN